MCIISVTFWKGFLRSAVNKNDCDIMMKSKFLKLIRGNEGMTESERTIIVEAITQIVVEKGEVLLSRLSQQLAKRQITISDYAEEGLKKWISTALPEFVIKGTYGHETVILASDVKHQHIALSSFDDPDEQPGALYGLLVRYDGETGWITSDYESAYGENGGSQVQFNWEQAQIKTTETVNMKETVYLVRYWPNELTIDYDKPIIICQAYPKEIYISLHIDSEYLDTAEVEKKEVKTKPALDAKRISRVCHLLRDSILKNGLFHASAFPELLGKCHIQNYRDYANSVEEFVKIYLKDEFVFQSHYVVKDKTYPGVILFRLENKHIAANTPPQTDEQNLQYGIISFCKNNSGFIDQEYVNETFFPDIQYNNDQSVIFDLKKAKLLPKRISIHTVNYLYLVSYATKGTVVDSKNKSTHPALDYQVPITVLRDFERRKCFKLVIQADGIWMSGLDNLMNQDAFDHAMTKIKETLSVKLVQEGHVPLPVFEKIIEAAGIVNFKAYAADIVSFLQLYLPEFECKRSGKSFEIVQNSSSAAIIESQENDLDKLRSLFDQKDYQGILLSPLFRSISFDHLSVNDKEMILTCAARIMHHDECQVTLTQFETELFDASTGQDFVKKWKGANSFDAQIVTSYVQSSWIPYILPEDKKNVFTELNRIGQISTNNNNDTGLAKRFALCNDALAPYLYFVRMVRANSTVSIERILGEYCQTVKDLKGRPHFSKIDKKRRLFALPELIKSLYTVFPDMELNSKVVTLIASTFMDCDCFELLDAVLPIIDPKQETSVWKLYQFFQYPDLWQEKDIQRLLKSDISTQLFQKTIALLWERRFENNELSMPFLRLLSWVCVYDYRHHSIDEIIRYHFTVKVTKLQKQLQLLSAFGQVLSMVKQDLPMYALATYIAHVTVEDIGEQWIPETFAAQLPELEKIGQQLYEKTCEKLEENGEDTDAYTYYFAVFQLDEQRMREIQRAYTKWYLKKFDTTCSIDQWEACLHELYHIGATDAYAKLFDAYTERWSLNAVSEELLEQYIETLISLRRYAQALSYLQNNEFKAMDNRDALMIRVLTENFRINTLMPEAFEVFSHSFTWEMAHSLLMAHIKDQVSVINCLMAMYCQRHYYCRVLYLYKIYQPKAETGFTRLYAKIRGCVPQTNYGKISNYYQVIEFAFTVLWEKDLMSFMKWVRLVPIPAYKELHREHVFKWYYDALIQDPMNEQAWSSFLQHMNRHIDKNLWRIVVCEAVFRKEFNKISLMNSGFAIQNILDKSAPDTLPYNLLPYVLSYLMASHDGAICDKLHTLLSDVKVRSHLIESNVWEKTYAEILQSYQDFAFQIYNETGESRYVNLINVLPVELDTEDLSALARSHADPHRIFAQLCQNYLQNVYLEEIWNLLNEDSWKALNNRDAAMLDLLKIIFDEDEVLLLEYPLAFRDENEVRRFKTDCVRILSAYPQKDGVFDFEKNCLNPTYKMIVYAFVFRVLYDDDIYHSPAYSLEAIDERDERQVYAFLLFLRTVYLAQLEWNVRYDFFYKEWRYMKLYLNALLIDSSQQINDMFIVTTMKQYDHYDSMYHDTYVPFTQDVMSFVQECHLDEQIKRAFLLSLMVGNIQLFLHKYVQSIFSLSENERILMRNVIGHLDYREASYGFFSLFVQEQSIDYLTLAQALSVHLVRFLKAWQNHDAQDKELNQLLQYALSVKPAECAQNLMQLSLKTFLQYADVIVTILYARQFTFQFYRSVRKFLINNRLNKTNMDEQIAKFAYYGQYDAGTQEVYAYLSAFRYCLQDKREKAQAVLAQHTLQKDIPAQWQNEAEKMKRYADGEDEKFVPDWGIKDSSKEMKNEEIRYSFIAILQHHLGVTEANLSKQELHDLYQRYQDQELSVMERLQAGISLLVNDRHEGKKKGSSKKHQLILSIGLDALKNDLALSADEQLCIAAELFKGIMQGGKQIKQDEEYLFDVFRKILSRDISLAGWIQYADDIKKYLGITHSVDDFSRLYDEIIRPCAAFLEPGCSNEERYEAYQTLLSKIKGFKTIYAEKVAAAIRREQKQIEEGIRLRITIINRDHMISDGYVYFQIENIGNCTASLCDGSIHILMRQDDYVQKQVTIAGIRELQKGYVTGGRAELVLNDSLSAAEVTLSLQMPGHKLILSADSQTLQIAAKTDEFAITKDHKYTVRFAVLDSDMLFGRETLKDSLKQMISTGLAVIYGPSRIGKTSLMNWVKNDYAPSKGNVMTLLFGGEGGFGKDRDYRESFADPKHPHVPYDDDQKMSDYLLAQTIIHGLTTMRTRLRMPKQKTISEEEIYKIITVLQDTNISLIQRYQNVNDVLEKAGVELWLLLDEFQQVIEQWQGIKSGCDFVECCQVLTYPESSLTHIKLIICGSDDLLMHMVLEDKSVWREAFQYSGVPVEPLADEPFCEMMRKDRGISGSNIEYADEALKALYTYTGGVALYGKEIGNMIIADIVQRPEYYAHRHIVYVNDVADATQKLLNQQAEELSTDAKEGIREIYDAVTKNLDQDTDMQYLWYMAQWLHDHNQDEFPESAFTNRALVSLDIELKNSLRIATERKIIKFREVSLGKERYYSFCTIFYYYAFLGKSRDNLDLDKIFESETEMVGQYVMDDEISKSDEIKRLFDDLSEDDQIWTLGGMALTAKSAQARKRLKEFAGKSYEGDDRSITINAQSIANTLNNILVPGIASEDILKGLSQLPRISDYLDASTLAQISADLSQTDPQLVLQAEEKLETGSDQVVSDYRAAIAMQDDVTNCFCVWKTLGLEDEDAYHLLSEKLDPSFIIDLYFAAKLDSIFNLVDDKESHKDYSPVSIMYCKVIEKMLKYYHTDVYRKRLPDASTGVKIRNDQKYFGDLNDKYVCGQVQNKIMLGAFLNPIHPFYHDEEDEVWEIIANSSRRTKLDAWHKHSEILLRVRNIRNTSAHGAEGAIVSKEMLDQLKEMLFKEHELLDIIKLCE